MKTAIALVLFAVLGLVASRGFASRLRARLPVAAMFLSGIEFFFIGVALGPEFLNLLSDEVRRDLTPIIYLALGWAGLLFGIQLSLQHLQRLSRDLFRFLAVDGLISIALGTVAFYTVLYAFHRDSLSSQLMLAAIVLALTAAMSSPTTVAVLAQLLPSRGRFTNFTKIATSLSAVIPMFVFGMAFIALSGSVDTPRDLGVRALLWLFANAAGIIMGAILVLFTLQKMARDHRLLVLMGTTLFMGGLCYFLQLSALYSAMIMGIVVANFSRRNVQIFEQLLSLEKTIYIAFLVLVGAMVRFDSAHILVVIAAYVVSRLLLKTFVSGRVIAKTFGEFAPLGLRSGLALSGQGAMSLAVAIDYGLASHDTLHVNVVTVIALSMVLNEFLGLFLARDSFRRSGEAAETQAQRTAGAGT